jgi:phage-related protein
VSIITVRAFKSGSRDVIQRFLEKDAKNVSDATAGLSDAIHILEQTLELDLKRTGKMSSVEGLREYRQHLKDHWLRILLSYVPTGQNAILLHIILKKTNKLDRDDIDIAKRNLKTYKQQLKDKK